MFAINELIICIEKFDHLIVFDVHVAGCTGPHGAAELREDEERDNRARFPSAARRPIVEIC